MDSAARVSLRHRDEHGQARDLVGELVFADAQRIVVLPRGRGPVELPRSAVEVMRRVPPRVVRPSSGVDDLQTVMARAWSGSRLTRMGGWQLLVGHGGAQRANSCLPTGDPERSLDEAIGGVVQHYRAAGLVPRFQLAARSFDASSTEPGAELDRELQRRGWAGDEMVRVMVVDLREVAPADPTDAAEPNGTRIEWADEPSQEWLALEFTERPERVAELRESPAEHALLRLGKAPVGGLRMSRTDDWVGLASVFVEPAHRGAGHGRALVDAATARAREQGARWCYLQVLDANEAARRLYTATGFSDHHLYRYRSLPASV